MPEMVLPDVYIELRPEGLIVPGPISIGNIGMVGTASKGPIGTPKLLGSFAEARATFGGPDAWTDGESDELTLVRALQIAYENGATSVVAIRVAGASAASASYMLQSASGDCVELTSKWEGSWGNDLQVEVSAAEEHPYIEGEEHLGSEGPPISLNRTPVVKSARNRIRHFADATGITKSLKVLYDGDPAPASGEVKIDRATGDLEFGDAPDGADTVTASYLVDQSVAVKVTIQHGAAKEEFTVVDGDDLAADVNETSQLVAAEPAANAGETPTLTGGSASFSGGDDGATGADYKDGLEKLLNEPVHIVVAAGQDDGFGDELDSHCQNASTDEVKRDRIAVVGSGVEASLDDIQGHSLGSDRVIFAAPGIKTTDSAATPPVEVTLPGSYSAAAVAGRLAAMSPHISLTNKTLLIGGLEHKYTSAELKRLLLARVLVLEERQGYRVVRGITTSPSPFDQITTRRIVDYAKYGTRAAANPFIGRLNNDRVRTALRASVNSFLTQMVEDEMLVSYELEVSATREEERQGIARVTMVLRPVFSIDFIKVTMYLE